MLTFYWSEGMCTLDSVGKFRRGFNEKNLASFAKLSCYPASRGFSLVFLSVVFLFAVLAARVLFWLFLCRGKDLCRQPFGIPVEHAH